MLTDAPPRKANRAGFLESERIKTLDLPQDGRLLAIAQSIESATAHEPWMSDAPAQSSWKPHHSSTEFQTAMSACLQRGRYECVKAGRASFSATTIQRP